MRWAPLAVRILILIKVFLKLYIASYLTRFIRMLSSYFFLSFISIILGTSLSSYSTFLLSLPASVLVSSFQKKLSDFPSGQSSQKDEKKPKEKPEERGLCLNDRVENLNGDDGPNAAAYVRVSTGRQAKEGYSLIDQVEKLGDLAKNLGISRVYWFIDAGKSARKHEFNKMKLDRIMWLAKKDEIDMLLTVNIARVGRECIGLLVYFFELRRLGVIIHTPEKRYDIKDLGNLIQLIIEAWMAEMENKRRAEAARDAKAQAFKQKRWNKPVPKGYLKTRFGWLEKVTGWDVLISEIYDKFIICKCYEKVKEKINRKCSQNFREPLTCHQIRRILTDPVYKGEPEHLGVKVTDPSLAYVDEAKFRKVQEIIKRRKQAHRPKRDTVKELTQNYGIDILELLQHVFVHCPLCDSKMVKNGTRIIGKHLSHIHICTNPDCRRQLVVPSKHEWKQIHIRISKKDELKK